MSLADLQTRRVFAERVADTAAWPATDGEDGITRLCTMVGALVLARATKDFPLSEAFLESTRKALADSDGTLAT